MQKERLIQIAALDNDVTDHKRIYQLLHQHSSAVVGTNGQCIGICEKRPHRESGTMGPIEMPFWQDCLRRDPTKYPKFHALAPIGGGGHEERSTQVD